MTKLYPAAPPPAPMTHFDTYLHSLSSALNLQYQSPENVGGFDNFQSLSGKVDGLVFHVTLLAHRRLGMDAPSLDEICTNTNHAMYPFLLQLAISEGILSQLRYTNNFKAGQVPNSGIYARMNTEIAIITGTQRRARQVLSQNGRR